MTGLGGAFQDVQLTVLPFKASVVAVTLVARKKSKTQYYKAKCMPLLPPAASPRAYFRIFSDSKEFFLGKCFCFWYLVTIEQFS